MERFSKREAYRVGLALLESLLKNQPDKIEELSFHGFGPLKELLLPIDNKSMWNTEDLRFEKEVLKIHELLKQSFGDNYKPALNSLKNSILSSFYTPEFIIDPIVKALCQNLTGVNTILEPAAGTGKFIKSLKQEFSSASITSIEKDDVTCKILKSLHPDTEVIHSGYENFKNRSYDLVVSNIPFGNINVFDDAMFRQAVPVKIKSTTRIHNYYFVKSLDNLREGGTLAFIAPSGVMDSSGNKEIRDYLVKNANLIAAIRLPNNIFQSAGTSPVSDIILLKKQSKKKYISEDEKLFIENRKISVADDKGSPVNVDLNGYYAEHFEKIIGTLAAGGQYDGQSLDVLPKDNLSTNSLQEIIQDEISQGFKLRQVYQESPVVTSTPKPDNVLPTNYPDYDLFKRGSLIVFKGKGGVVDFNGSEKIIEPQPLIRDYERTLLFIGLRNTYNHLLHSELEGEEAKMKLYRNELNTHYDLFTFRYGNLNHPANKKLFLLDSEGFKVLSLERLDGKNYIKADIFGKQVNNVQKTLERPTSLKDAILLSLNAHNKINIEFISKLLEKEKGYILREGLESGLLFRDVQHAKLQDYVTKDEFLSGNVVRKIELLEAIKNTGEYKHLDFDLKDIDRHLDALHEIKPAFLKRELIDINFGERWIPIDIYKAFAESIFDTPTNLTYLTSADQYVVNTRKESDEARITWGASIHSGHISGTKIMEYAMADTQPFLQIRIDSNPPHYVPDQDGMKNVEMKIKEMKEAFENFINERKDISEQIEELYNRNVNNSVRRDYDGSHLQLADLNHFTPRSHQKDAIWMILQQDGGIIDHKVGAGKTLVMVAGAMEMRRLGISNKPLILCMKANVADVAKDFLKAYPNAKVLAPDPQKDFTKQKRKGIFASIAANDWDAVIITHDMFKAIPQSPEMKLKVMTQELDNLEDDLRILSEDRSLSKRLLKGLEVRKENLKASIQETEVSIKRDPNILNFKKMGFDHIFVDESQEYKNLHFTTRHSRVAGLGDPKGSQRSLNLEFAMRTIQEKKGGDKGVTFLSGTTISNSLVELYLLFKYLRPNKLLEQKINSFDAWAKMYARKSSSYEFSVTNELKMKERFREFIKVPELARFYSEISHVITDHNLKVDKPTVENVIVNIEPTATQQAYTKKLIEFTRTKNPASLGLKLSTEEMSAYMLIATNYARKMSIDMRLISPDYRFEQDGKIAKLCQNVAHEYNDSTYFRGTQLIFSDIGTPSTEGFNIYSEIKRVLVSLYQLKPEEIQFIHDHDTKRKREALFKKVNAGEVRVLIGSTKKLGTGVNVQQRIIALHHLDIPWRPSDMEQRTGRGGRQGNRIAKQYRNNIVKNYVYAVNRTLDAYQFNILSNKQKFISQIKNDSIDYRKIDEGAFDQEGGMNFGEYVALLSGNTNLLEKVKLEKKLYDLERSFHVFLKRKSEAEYYIQRHTGSIKVEQKSLDRLKADWKRIENVDLEKAAIKIQGSATEDKKIVGEKLLGIVSEARNSFGRGTTSVIASLMEFDLILNHKDAFIHIVSNSTDQIYHYANGTLNENPALAGRYMIDSIKRIPKVIENVKEQILDSHKKIETFKKELKTQFKDHELIKDLKQHINDLNQKIEKETKVEDLDKKPTKGESPNLSQRKPRPRVRI